MHFLVIQLPTIMQRKIILFSALFSSVMLIKEGNAMNQNPFQNGNDNPTDSAQIVEENHQPSIQQNNATSNHAQWTILTYALCCASLDESLKKNYQINLSKNIIYKTFVRCLNSLEQKIPPKNNLIESNILKTALSIAEDYLYYCYSNDIEETNNDEEIGINNFTKNTVMAFNIFNEKNDNFKSLNLEKKWTKAASITYNLSDLTVENNDENYVKSILNDVNTAMTILLNSLSEQQQQQSLFENKYLAAIIIRKYYDPSKSIANFENFTKEVVNTVINWPNDIPKPDDIALSWEIAACGAQVCFEGLPSLLNLISQAF